LRDRPRGDRVDNDRERRKVFCVKRCDLFRIVNSRYAMKNIHAFQIVETGLSIPSDLPLQEIRALLVLWANRCSRGQFALIFPFKGIGTAQERAWEGSWGQGSGKSQFDLERATEREMPRLTGASVTHFFSLPPHRAAAALAAISDRFSGVIEAARAFPPTLPPRRPKATAAGFFLAGFSAVASPTMEAARLLRSAGRFVFERSGMMEGAFHG